MKRRHFLKVGAGGTAALALPASAQPSTQQLMPAHDLAPLIRQIAGGRPPQAGRVRIGLPPLAENGNSVPLDLAVESPMSESDFVRSVHILAERNPRPLVAAFQLGPQAGRAQLSLRIRLAGSQRVLALAVMADGSCWSAETEVVVTSAACLDEMSL